MNTRNNNNGGVANNGGGAGAADGASSGFSGVAGGYAITAQAAASPLPETPPPTNKRKTPLSGGSTDGGTPNSGWSVHREEPPEERCLITPHQICNRCEYPLDKVVKLNRRTRRPQAFGSCSSGICGGGGVILPGGKNCEFCQRNIQAHTVCLSVQRGENDWANAHTWNCLKDRKDNSTESAVAVVASKSDVGKKCCHCISTEPDNVIAENDVVVNSNSAAYHFKCAIHGRKQFLEIVHENQDRIFRAVSKQAKTAQDKVDNTRKPVDVSVLFDSDSN